MDAQKIEALVKNGRVLVAGDTHGDLDHWIHVLIPAAKQHKIKVILQLGDFGYWEHRIDGRYFLYELNRLLVKYDLVCIWIDGNHENHKLLRSKYIGEKWNEFIPIRSHIIHAPRGMRWEWNGVRFLALGGAYSIDRPERILGWSYWEEEMISYSEVLRSIDGGLCDVLLVHDCPSGINLDKHFSQSAERKVRVIPHPYTSGSRKALRYVVDETKPRLVLHGHWHLRYKDTLRITGQTVTVEGFGHNGTGKNSWGILDLKLIEIISD